MITTIFFKRFLNIVPVEDTYYKFVEKPEDIFLSEEAIKINYGHLSPFKEFDIVYYQTKNAIFLWFVKYKLPTNKINIPEGYLIYKYIKENKEAISVNQKDNIYVLSVIKEKLLLSQIIVKKVEKEKTIEFLKREYSLKDPKIIETPVKNLRPSIIDLYRFSKFTLYPEKTLNRLIEFVSISSLIVVFSIAAFYIFMEKVLQKELEKKQQLLNETKIKTKEIKEKLFTLQEEQQFWKNFIKAELSYPDVYNILVKVGTILKKNQGYINRFEQNENIISMWVGLKGDTAGVVEQLLKTNLFKEVKIVSSVVDRQRKDYKIVNLELYLKEVR